MSRHQEAIQITLYADPAEDPGHRLADRLLPWVPRLVPAIFGGNLLPRTAYPHKTLTFARAPGTGKDLTPEEVARIHTLLPQLAQEFPTRRQPFENNEVNLERVQIERLRNKTVFDRLFINRASFDKMIHQDKTHDYIAKRPYALEAIRRGEFRPANDAVMSAVATETMRELQHQHIPATHHHVQQSLAEKSIHIQQSLEPTWIEKKVGHMAEQIVTAFKLRDHYVGHDIDAVARNVALDSEVSRALSGRDPSIQVGGLLLGSLSFAAAWLEEEKGWEWMDNRVDSLIRKYAQYKYPRRYVFGERIDYPEANRAIAFGNVIHGVSSPFALWALQVKGRESLRKLLAQGNDEARKQLARVAREAVLADYSNLNRRRRATRMQSLRELFPFG